MALEPFAEPDDVIAVFRPLTTAEQALAGGLLAQISNKLRREARRRNVNLEALMADALNADAVTTAVVNAVKRVLMNPEAVRQISYSDGPFSRSRTIDAAISSGLLYLDEGDLDDVFPTRPKQRIQSFTVRAGM